MKGFGDDDDDDDDVASCYIQDFNVSERCEQCVMDILGFQVVVDGGSSRPRVDTIAQLNRDDRME